METADILQMGGFSAGTITIVLIVYRVLKYVKGKKFVSSCCGKKAEIGFDVRDMSQPSPPRPSSENKIEVKVENEHKQGSLQLRDVKEGSEGSTGLST